ncbi:tumor necrosis factor receptor superfamily member 14-like [Mya arenaria]|uniref:tumor necrosis factor receptor superfamily member 14-like n=1 Tax=Mya arenaria TaxID=6604 RepID=UPI0022E75A48|nr:tumor necrosis factor receptor superfamily member 14-like [Mya arenaria]XP_052819883.1 tumor necrosis factor receptor superfamily member 14-like [Mya arenaria]XP_052819884.1 tumor necrosis factor receptor superfamily member 14-like [Mya arenaria]
MRFRKYCKLIACFQHILCTVYVVSALTNNCLEEAYHPYYQTTDDRFCKKCPQGHYWIQDCDDNGESAHCAPCKNGSYSPCYNIALTCEPCDIHCPGHSNQEAFYDREYISEPCTATSNIKCTCKPDFYRESGPEGLCLQKIPCNPGQGVVFHATDSQTECQPCVIGLTFSNTSSFTEACKECTKCAADEHVIHDCNPKYDRVCGKNASINGDTTAAIDESKEDFIVPLAVSLTLAFVIVAVIIGIYVIRTTERGKRIWKRLYCKKKAQPILSHTNNKCRWPPRRPNDRELGIIADCFAGDYDILATQLELRDSHVFQIKQDNNSFSSQALCVLKLWTNENVGASLAELENIMRNLRSVKFDWKEANRRLKVT